MIFLSKSEGMEKPMTKTEGESLLTLQNSLSSLDLITNIMINVMDKHTIPKFKEERKQKF